MSVSRFDAFVPVLGLALLASASNAAPLAPGGLIGLTGTTFAANPALGGTVQDDPLVPFAIGGGALTGNLQDRVVLSDDLGTMIFAPRIRETSLAAGGPPLEILSISVTGYAGYTTDVDFRTDGLGDTGPDTVSRSVDGDRLNFRYSAAPLVAPDESRFISILTDVPAFAPIGTATIVARTSPTSQPFSVTLTGINAPVPEPTSAGLLLGGLAVLSGSRRR